jgi:DNA (cytosine-5)-methyltransferase 1
MGDGSRGGSQRIGPHDGTTATPGTALRFVDLFAGLGGFHVALSSLGHQAVFACELDRELRELYERNFGVLPAGDIRQVDAVDVPAHDILCAGFPCQPFSLAGKKAGAACPASGKLIDDVFRIVGLHRPQYVMLENVPNVLTIADGKFWTHIQRSFARLGYTVRHRVYSPLQFGIPQQRLRLFVVASRGGLDGFQWPEPSSAEPVPLSQFVIDRPDDLRAIEPAKQAVLEHWNRLLPKLHAFSSETLLASEFGANYPVEGLPRRGWRACQGAFGATLSDCRNRTEAIARLPHYAAEREDGAAPEWMYPAIRYSREVYAHNPAFFDAWKASAADWHNSWHKLEWRGDRSQRDLWHHTLQFRASGIRVMRPQLAPSLVAMSPTQTPIIGPQRRYMAIREAAALQALQELREFPLNTANAFKALGNAVNARIVASIAGALTVRGGSADVQGQRRARYGHVHAVAQSGLRSGLRAGGVRR